MSFVEEVREFNRIAGTEEKFDSRKVALYTGLVLEEVRELLETYNDPRLGKLITAAEFHSKMFKNGDFDEAAKTIDRPEALKETIDVAVVALGVGISLGGDIVAACGEVSRSNLSKFPVVDGERVVLKDENGKVKKPAEYRPANVTQYLDKSSTGTAVFGRMTKELTQ